MRLGKRHIGYGIAALAVAGVLFWATAPYPIAASIPHLPGVAKLLHSYMHNSVRNRTLFKDPPAHVDLDDEARIRLGAAHYETGCAPCHGSPMLHRNPIVRHMRPAPTPMSDVEPLSDGEYHYIGYRGIKYSGMPAWAGEGREDEVWPVVAFLMAYDGMSSERYAELALGPAINIGSGAGEAVSFGSLQGPAPDTAATCARCHGEDGLGLQGTAPVLAGQSEAYLMAALDAYAADARQSGIMEPLAAALSRSERAQLARHYAGLPGLPVNLPDDPTVELRGETLARHGDEDRDIPACNGCHAEKRKPEFPIIAGQHPYWIETWLTLWRERPNPALSVSDGRKMHLAVHRLSDEDIAALARYFGASSMARTTAGGE